MISVLYSETVLIIIYGVVKIHEVTYRLQRTSCRLMTAKNLPWHGLKPQLFLKFLLITQHEVPFINMSEATKRLSNQTENGTDVTNC